MMIKRDILQLGHFLEQFLALYSPHKKQRFLESFSTTCCAIAKCTTVQPLFSWRDLPRSIARPQMVLFVALNCRASPPPPHLFLVRIPVCPASTSIDSFPHDLPELFRRRSPLLRTSVYGTPCINLCFECGPFIIQWLESESFICVSAWRVCCRLCLDSY